MLIAQRVKASDWIMKESVLLNWASDSSFFLQGWLMCSYDQDIINICAKHLEYSSSSKGCTGIS